METVRPLVGILDAAADRRQGCGVHCDLVGADERVPVHGFSLDITVTLAGLGCGSAVCHGLTPLRGWGGRLFGVPALTRWATLYRPVGLGNRMASPWVRAG